MNALWTIARAIAVLATVAGVVAIAHDRGLASALTILFLFVPVGWIGVVAAWSLLSDAQEREGDREREALRARADRTHGLNPSVHTLLQQDLRRRNAALAAERAELQARDRTLEAIHAQNRVQAAGGRPVRHAAPVGRPIDTIVPEVRGPDERAVLRGEAVAAVRELAPNGEGELAPLDMPIRVAAHRDERRARKQG